MLYMYLLISALYEATISCLAIGTSCPTQARLIPSGQACFEFTLKVSPPCSAEVFEDTVTVVGTVQMNELIATLLLTAVELYLRLFVVRRKV